MLDGWTLEGYVAAMVTSQEVASVSNGASTTSQKEDNISKKPFCMCLCRRERASAHVHMRRCGRFCSLDYFRNSVFLWAGLYCPDEFHFWLTSSGIETNHSILQFSQQWWLFNVHFHEAVGQTKTKNTAELLWSHVSICILYVVEKILWWFLVEHTLPMLLYFIFVIFSLQKLKLFERKTNTNIQITVVGDLFKACMFYSK